MCGIAAILNGSISEVSEMGKALKHRGMHQHITPVGKLIVYFTWLPITDDKAKPQPYISGNWYVWLNGYISNYKELAEKYSINLVSNCDTELLAKFLDKFQFTRLNELNGFFAVLATDGNEVKTFTDRYGVKQLYIYVKGDKTYIASEVKSILAVNEDIELDKKAVDDWHYSLGVITENTIYTGIERVKCLPFYFPEKINISYESAKARLKELFEKAIKRNKVDGIKDCVFLSGGIDSGIIANYIKPNYCFSVDYLNEKYSEINNIKLNSKGVHYSIICNEKLAKKYAGKTMDALDDLKAGSCYTNFALTELASKFCTVIYSGAGGDEFFGGYPHRKNKPIDYVIRRTDRHWKEYHISHFEYDLKFLKAVLVVEDRICGFHTMETRYPLLDNDLIDFALSLPDEYLENKRILKDISELNEAVLNSPKKGFSNPYFTNEEWANYAINNIRNARHLQPVQHV